MATGGPTAAPTPPRQAVQTAPQATAPARPDPIAGSGTGDRAARSHRARLDLNEPRRQQPRV